MVRRGRAARGGERGKVRRQSQSRARRGRRRHRGDVSAWSSRGRPSPSRGEARARSLDEPSASPRAHLVGRARDSWHERRHLMAAFGEPTAHLASPLGRLRSARDTTCHWRRECASPVSLQAWAARELSVARARGAFLSSPPSYSGTRAACGVRDRPRRCRRPPS